MAADESKPKAKTGRPTKFSPERAAIILEHLAANSTRATAYMAAGVSKPTFLAWLEKGRKATSGPFRDFLDSVTRTEAQCMAENAATLKAASEGWAQDTVVETDEDVLAHRKIKLAGDTKLPDGTVLPKGSIIDQPVPVRIHKRQVVTRNERDWRPALEALRRRQRQDWGDAQAVTLIRREAESIEQMSDAELEEYLAASTGEDSAETGAGGGTP